MRHQIEEFHQQLDYTTPEQINEKKNDQVTDKCVLMCVHVCVSCLAKEYSKFD